MNSTRDIAADIIDINVDRPTADDLFLVDTNVWVLLTYPPATLPENAPPHQADTYAEFVLEARLAGSLLAHSALTVTELANVIEKIAFKGYVKSEKKAKRRLPPKFDQKQFRCLSSPRTLVAANVRAAWDQMNQFSAPSPITVDMEAADSALEKMLTLSIDGFDALLLVAAEREGIRQILTDDGDLAVAPGIQVFTANPDVLQRARTAGRLVGR